MRIPTLVTLILLLLAASTAVQAEDREQEIRYLLDSVGGSDCTFTRNGTEHDAVEAKAHLAMKYSRAGSRVKTAEQFVDRLASESSWTGKPYVITCAGTSRPSRDWLMERLDRYRAREGEREPAAKNGVARSRREG